MREGQRITGTTSHGQVAEFSVCHSNAKIWQPHGRPCNSTRLWLCQTLAMLPQSIIASLVTSKVMTMIPNVDSIPLLVPVEIKLAVAQR